MKLDEDSIELYLTLCKFYGISLSVVVVGLLVYLS